MKWTVQRYVLREVVQTWLAVTGVLVAILVSNQLSRVLGQAADNQYGRHVVFDLIALGAVMNLSVIVPVGLLLSVVLTLGRLYHDSEMAALQACGYAPARLLAPLFAFAAVIAVGLAWLSFFQVPRADSQVQALRRSAIKEAQFGQLDAGRFRSFSGGAAVFYAERVDAEGAAQCLRAARVGRAHRTGAGRHGHLFQGAQSGMHFVTLFNGRRYGTPGSSEFRVIEFREHGIPISTPADVIGPRDPDTKPTRVCGARAASISRNCNRASSPLMALVLTLVAVPLSRLRRGRAGMRVSGSPSWCISCTRTCSRPPRSGWKRRLPPAVGVWWVHLAVSVGLYLVFRESSKA
jgi:lipopolysaccharide export system permease protein